MEAQLSPRVTLALDVANVFGTSAPTQLQSNPYLVGPPGYAGGNAAYAAWYGAQLSGNPYLLGNGVPTNDGTTPALPWRYGTAGYVPSSYPEARSVFCSCAFGCDASAARSAARQIGVAIVLARAGVSAVCRRGGRSL